MLSLIRNISRKCVETLEALTDKALVTVLRSPELKQNFLQTTGIYIYIYIYCLISKKFCIMRLSDNKKIEDTMAL